MTEEVQDDAAAGDAAAGDAAAGDAAALAPGDRASSDPWRWLGLLLLVLVPVFVFRDVLFGGKVLFTLDTLTYVEPRSAEILRALAAGRFPLWSPHIACGAPFFAEMDNGVLSPFNLLLGFGARRWMDIGAPLMCALAGLFMYAFAREWRLGRAAAVVGGLAFGSGGFLVSYADNPPYLSASLYLPLFLLLWHRALARHSGPYLAATAGCLALMLTPGEAQTVYDAVLLAFGYGFVVPGVRRRWLTPMIFYALLGTGAVLLMAVQLLPTLELLRQAPRLLELEQVYEWSFHPARLLELLLPFAYGQGLPGSPYWGQFLHGEMDPTPWTRLVYVGLVPLVALPAAFAAERTRRVALLFAGYVTFMIAASLGPRLPVYRLLYELLPLMDRFRVPSKLWILVVFGLAFLGALGFDRLRVVGVGRITLAASGAAAIVGAGALLWPVSETAGKALVEPGWHLLVAGIALCGLGIAMRLRPAAAPVLLGAIVLLHALDLGLAGNRYARYFGDPAVAPAEPVAAARAVIDDDRESRGGTLPLRIYHDPYLVPGRGFRPPDDLAPHQSFKLWERRSLDWNHAMLWNLEYVGGYTVLQDKRAYALRQLLWKQRDDLATVLGRFDVRYLLLPQRYPIPAGSELLTEVEGGAVRIAKVTDPSPRVYLTRYGRAVPSANDILAGVLRPDVDLRRLTLLELPADQLPFPGVASAADLGAVEMIDYQPGRVRLELDVSEPRYVVFNESGYAGWQAFVDGAERSIHRANYLMQAVAVRPGERRVELRYRPTTFVVGAWLSGVSWLALLTFLAWSSLASRRRGAGPTPNRPITELTP